MIAKSANEQDLSYWAEWKCLKAGLKGDRFFFQDQWKTLNRMYFQKWQFHLEKEGKNIVHQGSATCEIPNDGKGRKVRGEQILCKEFNFHQKN